MISKYLIWGLGSMSLLASCISKEKKQKNQPNVILLLADDIGYGDLGCYNAPTIQTPNVDQLASEGVQFTNAHAVAATSTPSRYSIFTGHYSWRRKDTGVARGDAKMIIHPDQITLADLFHRAGYRTGAIGKWHLGLGDRDSKQNWNDSIKIGPAQIGFDYSYLMAATADRTPCVFIENQRVANYDPIHPIQVSYETPFKGEPLGRTHPDLLTKLKPSLHHGHDQAIINGISRIGYMKGGGKALWKDENINDSIVTKAKQFIERNKEHPFFLYLGTNDIHVPRFPHPRFVGKSGMGYRGDAILEFDWTVGEIMKQLEDLGIAENTIIILSSDNGPVVDDGYQDRAVELLGDHKPSGPFRGGKYSNFEAGTRIPLVVRWKGHIASKKSKALVSQIDLFSSLAHLISVNVNEGEGVDSRNYWDVFAGSSEKGRPYILESGGSLSVSTLEWKYIKPSNGWSYSKLTKIELGNSKKEQLYNLVKDVSEQVNLSADYPEIRDSLRKIINREQYKLIKVK